MLNLFQAIFKERKTIYVLAKRDYEKQNKGSILGSFWNYLQPFMFVAVLLFIFTSGFKTGANNNDWPFSVYLVTGIIPWLFFANTLNGMTGIIQAYNFLVKKVNFNLAVLPVVKIASSMPVYLVLTMLAIAITVLMHELPSLYVLQIFYYIFSNLTLLLGLGLLTSSLNVFFKDISNIVQVITQFGFWLTPIFWQMKGFSPEAQFYLKLNPMAYIVEGYRDSLFTNQWFWQKPEQTMYFWGFTLLVLVIGHTVFKRLQPHFSEVM